MTYTQAIDNIHRHSAFKYTPSLCRMEQIMHLVGNIHRKLKFIHVGGTNGKGTQSTLLCNILTQAGYKAGLFTSPYIEDFCERIRIGNGKIPQNTLADYTEKLENLLAQNDIRLNEFEFITTLALMYFYDENCDIVILEVGMGGEFDPTNIIEKTHFSVITSISLDHTHILGDSIEKIAACKSKIIKSGGRIIVNSNIPKSALDIIKAEADLQGAEYIIANTDDAKIEFDRFGSTVFCGSREYHLSMLGKAQPTNLLSVLKGVEVLRNDRFKISDETLSRAISASKMPARMERFDYMGRDIILDGSHNEESITNLVNSLKLHKFSLPVTVVFATMRDKAYQKSLEILSGISDRIIFTQAGTQRGMDAEELYRISGEYAWERKFEKDACKAITEAIGLSDEGQAVVICGSFYLVGEVRKLFNKT